MSIITVTGPMGAGAPQLADELSSHTGMPIIDRIILAEAAGRLGTSAEELESQTEQPLTVKERLGRSLQRLVQRSAMSVGDGYELMLGQTYEDAMVATEEDVVDSPIREAIESAIREMAQHGKVIFSGRAAHMALRDDQRAIHVGVISSMGRRIERVMERQALDRESAERWIANNDRGRESYYERTYHVKPDEPGLFHMVLNTDLLSSRDAALVTINAASLVSSEALPYEK